MPVFRELFGLPAHALIVHAAVVFIPLAALAAILYAAWPGVRRHIWWAVVGLGVVAPLAGWAARLSGDQYEAYWLEHGVSGPIVDDMNAHQALGDATSLWATALGVAMLVMALYAIPGPVALVKGASPAVVRIGVAVVTVVVAAVTLYYAIRTGDAGAHITHQEI
jgi:uncharacterized membrane protein YbaN (DUF454 family)